MNRVRAIILGILCLLATRTFAQETPPGLPILLTADEMTYDTERGIVTAHAAAPEIQKAQVVLRWRVALPSRKSDPSGCLDIVLRPPPA